MASYENQRVHFDTIMKKYKEYVELYRQLSGSTDGVVPFGDFYMRYTYLYRYADPAGIHRVGY